MVWEYLLRGFNFEICEIGVLIFFNLPKVVWIFLNHPKVVWSFFTRGLGFFISSQKGFGERIKGVSNFKLTIAATFDGGKCTILGCVRESNLQPLGYFPRGLTTFPRVCGDFEPDNL